MKRFTLLIVMAMVMASSSFAQKSTLNKITPDLQEELSQSKTNEMFRIIIIMNEQIDAHKSSQQMLYLGKAQQRKFMMNELQQLSLRSQKEVLKDLQQGQKAAIVDEIKTFWIINAVSCSANKDMVNTIAERPDVKYVLKDSEISTPDEVVMTDTQRESSENQWNVLKVHAPEVWNLGYTGQGIIVAVIDTGVNYNHTDIANNMWDGGDEYPNHGWDFVNNDNDPMDDVDHGTHCAGTVSSYGTNGKQCGIAKDAKIMALKTLKPKPNGSGGTGSTTDGWAAIEFAVSHGADILSMSLGSAGKGGNWAYRAVMENALHCGVIASVSAGNVGNDLPNYPIPNNVSSPSNCPSPWRHPDQTLDGGRSAVVAVGATTSKDNHSSFSSCGPSTWASGGQIGYYEDYPWTEGDPTNIGLIKPDISAPGSGIWSLSHTSNSNYLSMDGTSMAAPCVSGVIALMLSANPTLTPVEIDSIIETTAIPCGGQTSKNNTFGAGRIDALAAINYMLNACNAPTNLTATASGANVTLYWDEASGINTYRVYRNGTMIAKSVSGTTYYDENAPAGTNVYFVRSNGENHNASMPSNQVSVNINTNVEILAPCNLSIENSNENSATLSWESPSPMEKFLYHTESGTTYIGNDNETFITAQRFPSSMLQQYSGLQIEHIYFSVLNAGVECSIELFEGDAMQPNLQIHSGTITTTENEQMVDYIVSQAVQIDSNKDLWLSITMNDKLLTNDEFESNGNGDAFMYKLSSSDKYWLSNLGLAWTFKIGFCNGDYLYNVYRNGQVVSSNQSNISYTGNLVDGMNDYHVNSVLNGYESTESNAIKIVKTASTQENIVLGVNDKLIVLPNSTLTVTETLSNNNPENLILENGAQLIHSSEGVKATVKKDIAAWTTETPVGGWYFIASPINSTELAPDNVDYMLTDGNETEGSRTYDLYRLENDNWKNYRKNAFNLSNGVGYLYANESPQTLSFKGEIKPYDTENNTVRISSGWNLIGNPFTCNVVPNMAYHTLNNGTSTNSVNADEGLVAPGMGIAVYSENGGTLSFNLPTEGASVSSNGNLQMTLTQQVTNRNSTNAVTIDNAIVNFNESEALPKFNLLEANSKLYIPNGDKEYAIVSTEAKGEMPLNFKPTQDGTFTLKVQPESVKMGYLFLIDNMTGTHINLLTTPNYTFEAKTGDYESRFKLLFAAANKETENFDNEGFGFIINGQFQSIIGQGLLQVIDLNGRILRSANEMDCIGLDGLTAGVYVIRFITANSVRTQKIVVE